MLLLSFLIEVTVFSFQNCFFRLIHIALIHTQCLQHKYNTLQRYVIFYVFSKTKRFLKNSSIILFVSSYLTGRSYLLWKTLSNFLKIIFKVLSHLTFNCSNSTIEQLVRCEICSRE